MKISSRAKRYVRDFNEALRAGNQQRLAELLSSPILRDLPMVVAAWDQTKDREEMDLLCDLANMNPGDRDRLQKHFPSIPDDESEEALLALRDQLRAIWPSKPNRDIPRQAVLQEWFETQALTDPEKWFVLFQWGIIRPVFFRGELAWAFCRHSSRLAMCGNPECPAPYFVASKRTQKYCSKTDECARYATRAAALKYWRNKEAKKKKT